MGGIKDKFRNGMKKPNVASKLLRNLNRLLEPLGRRFAAVYGHQYLAVHISFLASMMYRRSHMLVAKRHVRCLHMFVLGPLRDCRSACGSFAYPAITETSYTTRQRAEPHFDAADPFSAGVHGGPLKLMNHISDNPCFRHRRSPPTRDTATEQHLPQPDSRRPDPQQPRRASAACRCRMNRPRWHTRGS